MHKIYYLKQVDYLNTEILKEKSFYSTSEKFKTFFKTSPKVITT